MRVLYLDCFSGISGDMFLSALLDLGLDIKLLKTELNKLKLEGKYSIETKRVRYNAISAFRFIVKESQKKERSLDDIKIIINKSTLDMDVKKRAVKMFEKLQKAEKKIHGETHHFHELGLLDTIIDVVGAIAGLKILGIKKVFASKINVGKGFVKTMHGLLPIPAPATAELLKGIPIFSGDREAELVTPTGALLLSEFVDEFTMPQIKIDKIGYGAGTKKFENPPNLLRAYIGEID